MKDTHSEKRRGRLRVLVTAVVVALVVAPAAAIAGDRFLDVPGSNTFHTDIGWMADNGVTRGCNPPSNNRYCPKDNVTREQMAAFIRRLATTRVVDAGRLDGRDATDFARADTGCLRGALMTGIDRTGRATCTTQRIDAMIPIASITFDAVGRTTSSNFRAPLTGQALAGWDASTSRYVINLPGVAYDHTDGRHNVQCTPVGRTDRSVSVSSASGDVLVYARTTDGTQIQNAVSCVVWRMF